jgi:hypothetical protein
MHSMTEGVWALGSFETCPLHHFVVPLPRWGRISKESPK